MTKRNPFKGLILRSAAVRLPDVGYVLAADPKKEKEDEPHAVVARWRDGAFNLGTRNYNAHSLCVVSKPDIGFVDVSGQGYYAATLVSGMTLGDILEQSSPPPKKKRTASFRAVAAIDGKAYAVGLRGLVYRFDEVGRWSRIDDGLPETFNVQAIDGFSDLDLYAVGRQGMVWHFDGQAWSECDLPMSQNLTAVKCAGDGKVYIGGHGGLLVRGRANAWEVVEHRETEDDFWDIEWFERKLYVSTMKGVYWLKGDSLTRVDFGDDPPKSCYQLSAAKNVMWSNGEFDIMSFDGKTWSRVV
jgi:hypothetical protein